MLHDCQAVISDSICFSRPFEAQINLPVLLTKYTACARGYQGYQKSISDSPSLGRYA